MAMRADDGGLVIARPRGHPPVRVCLLANQMIGNDSGLTALGELGEGGHYRGEVPSFEVGIH